MRLIPQFDNFSPYLDSSDIIDFGCRRSREVSGLSLDIYKYSKDGLDYIKNAYEYVRDQIFHSADINGRTVTCRASEVLRAGEGICFAKAHLLAALLRCKSIPCGFCYQRLILDDASAPYLILHGLNAVYIENTGKWIRLDARGNKPGVDARFSLDEERLAFPERPEKGEEDIPTIFARPDRNVVAALTGSGDFRELWARLPTELSAE